MDREQNWKPGHLVLDVLELPLDAPVFEAVVSIDIALYEALFGSRNKEEPKR